VIHYAHPPADIRDACARWREIETAADESRHVVAIIDDADRLPIEVQVAAHGARLVEGGPRVQFVLGAKPCAYERFSGVAAHLDEAMARCTLGRLDDDEVAEFVAHRLGAVGIDRRHFTREALAQVASCALGIPQLVNRICTKACFVAEMNGEGRVSAASVEEAAFVLRLGDVPSGRALDEDHDAARSAA
jgi:type II secretory pathway predicted ATPase ExeA